MTLFFICLFIALSGVVLSVIMAIFGSFAYAACRKIDPDFDPKKEKYGNIFADWLYVDVLGYTKEPKRTASSFPYKSSDSRNSSDGVMAFTLPVAISLLLSLMTFLVVITNGIFLIVIAVFVCAFYYFCKNYLQKEKQKRANVVDKK